ncbi:uncharacterized protein [Aegilops tauschii subsp. strangulata]|uniref:uncharacterized protein n=1 Tax=Aegilops tauschii subsp. strangulata TaxID=200361 RepID=UPI003CC8E03A
MCYSVYITAKKLKQYFQERTVTVVSMAPVSEIMGCQDTTGRVAKWAIELACHTILYEPRTTIKSQELADYLVYWTETQYLPPPPDSMPWHIVLSSPKGDRLRYMLQIYFAASNNIAEYKALVHGLRLAKEIGVRCILCYSDSDLVVQQAFGEWDARDANMASYRFLVQQHSGNFDGCEFLHVPCMENEAVDTLAKIGSTRQSIFIPNDPVAPPHNLGNPGLIAGAAGSGSGAAVPIPGVANLATEPAVPNSAAAVSGLEIASFGSGAAVPDPDPVAVFTVVMALSWAQPILAFPKSRTLPMDETEARQVQSPASAYCIINHELVKRTRTGIFQCCVEQDKGIEILLDIHQGECGHHASSRSLVAKAFRHGFYWPTTLKDADSLVLKCEGCQHFSKRSHQPVLALQTIPITWPFAV